MTPTFAAIKNAKRYFRMGLAEASLQNCYALKLPPPDLPTFADHTTRNPQGGGGEGRHGHTIASLLWLRLTAPQAYIIQNLIAQAEATGGNGNGTLWLTLPRNDATAPGLGWIDISGIVVMPNWIPLQRSYGLVYENVILRLVNCTVENTPSTVLS